MAYLGRYPTPQGRGDRTRGLHLPSDLPLSLPSSWFASVPTFVAAEASCIRRVPMSASPRRICIRRSRSSALGGSQPCPCSASFSAADRGVCARGCGFRCFDGGLLSRKREANVAALRASAAQYRSTVIKRSRTWPTRLRRSGRRRDAHAKVAGGKAVRESDPRPDAAAIPRARRLTRRCSTPSNAANADRINRVHGAGGALFRYDGAVPGARRRAGGTGRENRRRSPRRIHSAAPNAASIRRQMRRLIILVKKTLQGTSRADVKAHDDHAGVASASCSAALYSASVCFKGDMIKKSWRPWPVPAADGLGHDSRFQEWQPQAQRRSARLRAVNGADLSLEVAGIVRRKFWNSSPATTSKAGTGSAAAAPRTDSPSLHVLEGRRRTQSAITSTTATGAVQDPGGQPGPATVDTDAAN